MTNPESPRRDGIADPLTRMREYMAELEPQPDSLLIPAMRAALTEAEEELAAATARVAALEGALRDVEWIRHPDHEYEYCPCCERVRNTWHATDCELRAALAGEEGG